MAVNVGLDTALPPKPSWVSWAVAGFAFAAGIAASVAANVAHAQPTAGARFIAGWAPLALLLTIEVMMHVPPPQSRVLNLLRYIGTIGVAGVAAVASFRHMKGLALDNGEDLLTANTLPLSVDGLVMVASIALLTLAGRRRASTAAGLAQRAAATGMPMPAAKTESHPTPAGVPAAVPVPGDGRLPVPAAVPVPGDGRLPVPAAVPVPSDDDRGLADVSLSLDPDGSSVPLSGQPADASVPPSTLGALASLPAATALPLPLPLAEAVVPPVPWPRRRGGDVNADSLDFGPAFARLDSETRRLYQQAYDRFLEAAADGKTLTGREVGEACGRGDRWGRDRIAEVRAAQQRAAESKELATSVASQT